VKSRGPQGCVAPRADQEPHGAGLCAAHVMQASGQDQVKWGWGGEVVVVRRTCSTCESMKSECWPRPLRLSLSWQEQTIHR
jgi:hypothetical protein